MNTLFKLQVINGTYTFELYAPDEATAIAEAWEYRGFKCRVVTD